LCFESTLLSLSDSKARHCSLQSSLGAGELKFISGFGDPPFSSFPGSPRADNVDFCRRLGCCSQDGNLIVQNLGEASHYCDVHGSGADPVPKLSDLELAKERDVTGEDAKFTQFSGRNNNVYRFADNFSFRRNDFQQNFFGHMLTIFLY